MLSEDFEETTSWYTLTCFHVGHDGQVIPKHLLAAGRTPELDSWVAWIAVQWLPTPQQCSLGQVTEALCASLSSSTPFIKGIIVLTSRVDENKCIHVKYPKQWYMVMLKKCYLLLLFLKKYGIWEARIGQLLGHCICLICFPCVSGRTLKLLFIYQNSFVWEDWKCSLQNVRANNGFWKTGRHCQRSI